MPAEVPAGRRAVYQFIRPRRSIKQELLAQRWSGSSSADHSDVILKPSLSRESQNLWQKASSLRQSLRVKGSSRKGSSSDSKSTSSHCLSFGESQRPCRPERKTNNKPSKNDIIGWDGCRNNKGNHHDEVPTSDADVTVVVSRHVRSHSDYSGLGTELFAGDRLRHPSTVSTSSSVASQKEMLFQSSSEHLVLPRHQRSPRKLTKDSGYETSAQGEPDYVNADWVNEGESEGRGKTTPLPSPDTCGQKKNGAFAHFRTSSFSGDERLEKYIQQPSQPSRYLHGHQSCKKESGRHHPHQQQHHLYSGGGNNRSFSCYSSSESLCLPPPVTATPVARRPELCNSRYSSSESLTSWSSSRAGSLLLATKSSPSLANKEKRSLPPPPLPPPYQSSGWYSSSPSVSPARSTPNLEQEAADMVTRRFTKKRSVYEALANKSGLDFAPVIHRQPYWERREIFEDDSSSCRQPGRFHGNHLYGVSQDEGPRSLPECGVKNLTKDDSERHLFPSRDNVQNGQPTESMSSAQGPMSYVNKSSSCHKDGRPLSPPSIPTRDSSLRYRASSAHEKYPSWPVTSPGAVEIGSQVNSSSQRSNSWTEQTDYTKESHVPYSRPKKMYQISTHQLHPVQEKAGEGANKKSPKIEPESLPRRHLQTEPSTTGGLTADSIAQYFDFDYQKNRSQRCHGDREYNTHSPPERDTSVCSARDDKNSNSFDDDPYIKKYEDMLRYYSQSPALYGNWNRENHQMTVADSTTPLLDRLRMESESLPSVWPPSQELDTPSEAGTCAESVDSNSSSQETLKWHGSYSDLSILSVQASNRSLQFDSGHSTLADSGRLTPQSMSGTVSPDCSSRAHVVARQGHQPESLARSARVEQPQRHESESISYCVSGLKRHHKTNDIGELFDSPTSQQLSLMNTSSKHHSSNDLTTSHDNRMNYSNKDIRNPGTISQAFSTTFPGFSRNAYNSESHTLPHEMCPVIKPNLSLSSCEVSPSISKAKIGSSDLSSAYRDKLANKIQTSLSSSSISDIKESYNPLYSTKCWSRQRSEDNNQKTIYDQKQTKKHRISDPELKAIQKQAVLSFYHRQTALASAEASSDAKSDRCNHNSYSPHFQSTIQENLEGECSSVVSLISPSRSTKLPFSKSSVGSQQQHYPDTEERPSKPVPRISDASESDASVSSPHRRDATSPPESLKFSFEAKSSLGAASSGSQQSLISEHSELQRISPGGWSDGYSIALSEEGIKTSSPNQSAHSSSDLKERTDRASSSGSLWPHAAGRKAQLKKIYSSNETAVVKVISSEGVTLVETVEAPEARKNVTSVKPQVPPKRINKPLPPPPPLSAVASRPPAPPPPPPSSASEPIPPLPDPEEDEELREIEDSIQNHLKVAPLLFGSTCSSPDLPLPPPPANTDTEVLQTDDPLPPPPPDTQDVELSVASEDHGTAETHPVSSCLTYQRESGPAGDHARLATASESPSLVQTDAAPQPPISNCNGHITEMTYENVPSAKSSRLLQSPAREDSSRETFASSAQQQIFLPTSEASLETVPACSPQRDGTEDEVEALYANLDLLQLRIQNGDHYGLLSNGCEISPPAIISVTNSATQTTDTPRLTRKKNSASKSHAELECERLSRDFVNHFGDTTLRNLLLPAPNHKTMSDYMEGLLDLELEKGGKPTARSVLSNRTVRDQTSQQTPPANDRRDNVGLPLTSAYFTTSEPKAKLLTRYCHSLDRHDWANEIELGGKKEELIASIGKKLDIMRLEQVALQEEMNQNEQLGREVTAKVEQLAKPNELEKYRLHVEELEKIINLLLSLSGRLARAQNALLILPKDAREEERCILEAKRDKLSEQHEEARRLKESIDRRSYQVSTFLHHYLSKDEYADYDHFIKMKSKLLMDAREIDEKIKLGEEQLAALRSSMDPHLWNGAKIDLQSNAHTVVNRT